MIDFRLTDTDKAGLARTRAEALICRKYARYHDENEGDFPPGELPEAEEFYKNQPEVPAPGPEDTSLVVMAALHAASRSATVTVTKDAEFLVVSPQEFLELLGRTPRLGIRVQAVMSDRLRHETQGTGPFRPDDLA